MQIALHILIATVLFFSTCFVKPQTEYDKTIAEIVGVNDGDTVMAVFLREGIQRKIRLATIDAPEFNQPFGRKARKSLSDLVFRRKVTVVSKGKDPYGRILAELILDDTNINVEQIKRGFAWHYKYYAKSQSVEKRIIYSSAERSAREKRRGLWWDDDPDPPWVYRKQRRERENIRNK